MSAQWFYIQRWAKKRWEYVREELSFTDAKSLFKILDNENEWRGTPTPLALLQKGESGMVVTQEDQVLEGWKIVSFNDVFSISQRVGE